MVNALEIKTSIVPNLIFANNTILSCLFLFSLVIDLYFLIHVVIAQFFITTAKLEITIGTPTNEANAVTETQPMTAETKTRKCSK